jgi:hypothetical protein
MRPKEWKNPMNDRFQVLKIIIAHANNLLDQ